MLKSGTFMSTILIFQGITKIPIKQRAIMASHKNKVLASFIAKMTDKTNNTLYQIIRYLFVGGIAFIVDFGLLYLLTEKVRIYYLLSASISFIAGLVVNYVLSIIWVFNNRIVSKKSVEFIIFTVIGIVGLILNNFLLWYFTEMLGLYYLISKIIATLSTLIWNFAARKLVLFRGKDL
jgi:putative flippase GtrA